MPVEVFTSVLRQEIRNIFSVLDTESMNVGLKLFITKLLFITSIYSIIYWLLRITYIFLDIYARIVEIKSVSDKININ